MRGWANYFKHAVCKNALDALENFTWRRVIRWWMALHRWKQNDVRRHLTDHTGRWHRPSADGIELSSIASVPVTRYRYRGSKIPAPGRFLATPDDRDRGEPVAERSARRVRRAAWRNGPEAIPAPRSRPTQQSTARIPAAWARRNCRQVGPERRGAGPVPAARRISHTVDGATVTPSFTSSPWIRRCPHRGFSLARRTTKRAMLPSGPRRWSRCIRSSERFLHRREPLRHRPCVLSWLAARRSPPAPCGALLQAVFTGIKWQGRALP